MFLGIHFTELMFTETVGHAKNETPSEFHSFSCAYVFPPSFPHISCQFVCVESLVTAVVDMYPALFRRKNRRELFLLAVSLFSFFMGLIMLMEVRVTLWDHTHTHTDACTEKKICKQKLWFHV